MAMNSLLYRLSLWFASVLYVMLSRILFASYRITYAGEGEAVLDDRVRHEEPFIAAFWHNGVIFFPYLTRGKKWVAMVSASKDGEYIARILQSIGYKTARGSSNRQGVSALKNMLGWMRQGHNAGIVADGSQGPERKAQPGPVLLASKTGCPIMPMAWSASSYWTFRSWDRTVLPKPFARIHVEFGPPLEVPEGIRAEAVEGYRQGLEEAIDAVYAAAWRRFGKEEH